MRIWRTGNGGTLVERSAGSFVLFALSGAVEEAFESQASSAMSHAVEGSELVRYSKRDPDLGRDGHTSWAMVRGLVAMAAEDCTVPLDGIDGLVSRFKAERGRR